ncbi:hypothetical protein Hanom_Chr03g00217671 [Helianthus anomalus]
MTVQAACSSLEDFNRWFSKGYYHRYIVNYFTKYEDLTDLVIMKDR